MWGQQPMTGDWVRIREKTPVTATDHITGSGIPAGARGVVTGTAGSKLEVEFETGYGTTKTRIAATKCTVIRRHGGRDVFIRRVGFIRTVRLALCLFLSWPLIQFVMMYWWEQRTFDGIVEEFTLASVDSIGDWVLSAINNPVPVLLYAAFILSLSKFAFRQ
jgi:hypothetical protein